MSLALAAFGLSYALNLTRDGDPHDAFIRALAYWAVFWAVWLAFRVTDGDVGGSS